jgi:hypothetical protein
MSARLQMHTPTHLHTFAPTTRKRLYICTSAHGHSSTHLHTSAGAFTHVRALKAAHIHPRPRNHTQHPAPSTQHPAPSTHAPPLSRARAAARRHHPAEMIRAAWLVLAQIAPRGWLLPRSPRPPGRAAEEPRPAGGDPFRWRAPPPASRSPARVARIYISKNAPSEKKCTKNQKKV